MPSVQIKNVPEETHRVLRRRAAAAHQSLQEYLRAQLIEQAKQRSLDDVLADAAAQSGGSATFADTVALVRSDRDRR
ncbi:FitA-like ribbon-helix-helix domain-containing protein [Ruania zhangjianzhongii]|uniref:FitA-like ribbon-helix-helix domain-containing protein n=1 Tax=Ruania zhangjianzhongii TaxID=2603206 RepID=UPI0011CA2A40|nr:hypothetical protein [Ruania zhangjianzhongii]